MTSHTSAHGGQVLIKALAAQGVERVFCVPGESYLAALDALHDADIDTIVARHEGGAAMMAEADGKLTGRPGVAFVTRGPGATNASSGVHVAFQDSTPMVLFIGQVASDQRDREAFQEVDYGAIFTPLAKWVATIDRADRIPEYISHAFHVAQSGRPGPVVLALPEDMLSSHCETEALETEVLPAANLPSGRADQQDVQAVLEALSEAEQSRLGFDHPKGLYPIGPVSGAPLLQVHCEKAAAMARRYGAQVPVYMMTSPVTHDEQAVFLAKHDRFGLPADDLIVFCQGTMPAVDAKTGKLLLAEKDALFLSPDGHGGAVAALAARGAIDDMHRRGVEHLFYLQVDNPLVPLGDAEFIGYHLLAHSDLTSMAVAKQAPRDRVGNFAMIDGRLHVIEYSDFPDDVAEKRNADGSLVFWAGSIAVHMFRVAFLERALALRGALPFHVAHKKVPYIDQSGQRVDPPRPNALKFERFIFDLLPHARNPLVVEYAEADVFAPLKNAPGAERDTAEYVQRLMVAQHRQWLEAAGTRVSEDALVEISPLWALDAKEVAARPDRPASIELATYLSDENSGE